MLVFTLFIGIAWSNEEKNKSQLDKMEADYDRYGRRVVKKDTFPVLHNPGLFSAKEADEMGPLAISDKDMVIGISIGKEAKAYPVAVMGVHELVNDTCDKEPIAVSW